MSGNYERRMHKQREYDARRESLCRVLHEDSRVQQVNRWQDKAASQRYKCRTEAIQDEQRREELHRQSVVAAERRAKESQQESKLADEMRRKKQEDRADASRVELIVQNDPRLRDLQRKLKNLYITKERSEQLKSKALHEYKARVEEAEIDREILRNLAAGEQRVKQEEASRREWVEKSKKDLLEQIQVRKDINSRQAQEEYAKDKADVDRILQGIIAEETEAMDRKQRKQDETRALLHKYQKQHEEEKARRIREEKEQEAAINAYQEKVYKRKEAAAAAKEEEAARQEKIYEEILRQQADIRAKEEELLDIRETLSLEEAEQREVEKERERQIRIRQMRQEMIDANEAQKEYKQHMNLESALEEQALRERMLAKFEEDCERERAVARKRHQDMLEHKETIERQRQDRYNLFLQSQEQEKQEQLRQQQEDEFRERVVQEAARRLLEQHREVVDQFGSGMRGIGI